MIKAIDKPRHRRRAHRESLRFVLVGFNKSQQKQFGGLPLVAHCKSGKVRDLLPQVSRDSLWISPDSDTTDDLLRNLSTLNAPHHGSRMHLGDILLLEPPRPGGLPILHGLFEKVIGEAPSFKMLPLDQLADVLSAPEEENRDLFVGGIVDIESNALALVRGNLETIIVPLSMFRPSPVTRPDFRWFELDDYGQTIRFGQYESAADAILYEVDADYRKRIHAKRRAEEKGFGPSLRRLRLQRRVARESFPGIAAKTIARIERGEVAKPHGRTLQVIAQTLEVEPDQIETF